MPINADVDVKLANASTKSIGAQVASLLACNLNKAQNLALRSYKSGWDEMKANQINYLISGLIGRIWGDSAACPSCGSSEAATYDRKFFHHLLKCGNCGLLFRYPYESAGEMAEFYQTEYQQDGLTTNLPNQAELQDLLRTKFAGSAKDGSRFLRLFEALAIPDGAKILDYGANWGYSVWQFRQAGYDAHGYEISVPRANFGNRLDLDIAKTWKKAQQNAPFDIVFSAHVLEHTRDPANAIREKASALRPGGYMIALFPNGSRAFRKSAPKKFHRFWGQVHPVLLNDDFVQQVFPTDDLFMGACTESEMPAVARWKGNGMLNATINTKELLVIWKKP